MPPRIPGLTTIILCALFASLFPACERKREPTEPPTAEGGASGGPGGGGGQCVSGGPSVSLNVRGTGSEDMPNEDQGKLLGWIGGFAQPCRDLPPKVPHFTLEIDMPAEGQPILGVANGDALPELTACLSTNFSTAPPPPIRFTRAEIVIPWGCNTLQPGFQAKGSPEADAAEPAP
jgi:hypothetical protein